MNRFEGIAIALTTLVVSWATALSAADGVNPPFPDIAGPEIWVDGPDAVQPGAQRDFSDVAVDNNGRRIHVWGASGGAGLPTREIFLRRWDAEGNPLEDPKMVNTTTADQQDNPRVAVSADGSFLVIFESRETVASQGGALRILVRSQAYDANGDPVGSEQLLTTVPPTSLFEAFADVAALRTADGSPGGYIVVWRSNASAGTDTSQSTQGCLVDSSGVPGAQFQVNSDDPPNQTFPTVTELADGGFLAAWTAGSNNEIWGRRFNSAGGPVGNDFKISTGFVATKFEKDAAIGWDGTIAIVWVDADESLPATDENEIRLRLYDDDLVPLGPDFRVNTLLDQDQREPRVADFGPAGFLVVWESETTSGNDQGDSIEARVVTGSNQFDGLQVQYNTWDDNKVQQRPSSHGWYGRLATDWNSPSWDGDPSPDAPGTVDAIVGRDIEHCMFCDDFEWFSPGSPGSLWRWSATAGVVP
jgi:hypothetical protein